MAGEWLIGETGGTLRIGEGGSWDHPSHGIAKIRKAEDAADINVFYQKSSARCSYRVVLTDAGNTLTLIAADPTQDGDYCPEGSLKRIGGR